MPTHAPLSVNPIMVLDVDIVSSLDAQITYYSLSIAHVQDTASCSSRITVATMDLEAVQALE